MRHVIKVIVEIIVNTNVQRKFGEEVTTLETKIKRLKNIQQPQELADVMKEATGWKLMSVWGETTR